MTALTLLPNEVVISTSVNTLMLTSHRIRSANVGGVGFTSIMLEHLVSCSVNTVDTPFLMRLAILFAFCGAGAGLFFGNTEGQVIFAGAAIASVILLIFYFSSRRTFLIFASGGGTKLELTIGRMNEVEIITLFDQIETAKDLRATYLAGYWAAS